MDDSLPIRDRSPILRCLRGVPRAPREQLASNRRSRRPRDIVAATALPFAIGDTVVRVVSMVGGTRAERAGLARELCAHFEDALAAGTPPDRALAEFGDPHLAARLLRRAVRRKRGSIWMTAWWASRAVAVVVVAGAGLYAWAAARYWLRAPTIDVNYVARLQSSLPKVPPTEAGWPLYRDAILALQDGRTDPLWTQAWSSGETKDHDAFLAATSPEHADWALASAFRASHAGAFDLLHRAAAREAIGVTPGRLSLEDQVFFYNRPVDFSSQPELFRDSLIHLLLWHMSPLRTAGLALIADARHAIHEGDSLRATTSLVACLRLAVQIRDPLPVSQIVSNDLASRAASTISAMVSERGGRFSATDLERLAAALREARDATWKLDVTGASWILADVAQRAYSDDGSGGGHLVASASIFGDLTLPALSAPVPTATRILAPLASATVPSRHAFLELGRKRLAALEAESLLPPWKRAGAALEEPSHDWMLVRRALPAVDRMLCTANQLELLRSFDASRASLDAAEVAVAVRRFRQAHGAWPLTLDALVPTFLADVPRDPWADAPLRYGLLDGQPALWSIGPNQVDDGGVADGIGPRPQDFVVPPPQPVGPGDLVWWRMAN
ncbi:MAG: hypothetical protein JNM94_18610 [Phycisphaerae bacterium]|nr:hypothetical protein [Phycisphaerae bacterium]